MSEAPKQYWLVIIPDAPGALAKRMEIRPAHLKALTPAVESGFWKMGGGTLASPKIEGQPLDINGSAMLAFAATAEEVLEKLKGDIYAKNNVWDFSKVQIFPFVPAFLGTL